MGADSESLVPPLSNVDGQQNEYELDRVRNESAEQDLVLAAGEATPSVSLTDVPNTYVEGFFNTMEPGAEELFAHAEQLAALGLVILDDFIDSAGGVFQGHVQNCADVVRIVAPYILRSMMLHKAQGTWDPRTESGKRNRKAELASQFRMSVSSLEKEIRKLPDAKAQKRRGQDEHRPQTKKVEALKLESMKEVIRRAASVAESHPGLESAITVLRTRISPDEQDEFFDVAFEPNAQPERQQHAKEQSPDSSLPGYFTISAQAYTLAVTLAENVLPLDNIPGLPAIATELLKLLTESPKNGHRDSEPENHSSARPELTSSEQPAPHTSHASGEPLIPLPASPKPRIKPGPKPKVITLDDGTVIRSRFTCKYNGEPFTVISVDPIINKVRIENASRSLEALAADLRYVQNPESEGG